MAKADIYQSVTDSIVAMLEAGVKPWAPQWAKDAGGLLALPSRVNGEAYRGLNTMLLWGAAEAKGYRHQTWMTFRQAKELGGCVRKGEKATQVVYWGRFDPKGDDGEDGEKSVLFAKAYSVFNVEQIDGLPDRFFADAKPLPKVERNERAERWITGVGADVRHGGNKAFFSPATDHVQMPPAGAFDDVDNYYSTLAHELTHWTGAKARLDRRFGKRFGDRAYAFEELIAELGAAFAMARLGIAAEPRDDHASYLASWLKVLKADKRAIFTAASKAQQACDFLFELANKAEKRAMERPSVPLGVICLPDLSKPVSEPNSGLSDDGDDDPTPPVPPSGPQRPFGELQPVAASPMTLLEFLSRAGGLRDDGGELRAMDAHIWHRAKPFRRRLVAVTGMALDYACDLAWERGFFDDVPNPDWQTDNAHPVTHTLMFEAIRRELAGKPRYADGLYVEPETVDYEERWEEAYPEEAAFSAVPF